VQVQLSFYTYFLLYPFVITLQDWSVNYVRKLKCQPCVEAAQLTQNLHFLSTYFWKPNDIQTTNELLFLYQLLSHS
ncbi:MAG: hypothetical protein M3P08_16625, partial [Thermoproteota archaeon]|nr:hypothetical protein [Thermoproteota archaeon]